ILVQAPGGVNEPGIDMVSHDPGGRTQLLDNKAIKSGRRQREVPALEENLPENLAETIQIVKDYVADTSIDVHPSIATEALPHLETAWKGINDWIKENGGDKVDLASDQAQKAFAEILDKNGIDRIVTLAGAGTNTGITKPLRAKGFSAEPE